MADRSRLVRVLLWVGAAVAGLIVVSVLAIGLLLWSAHRPLPQATPGPKAEALAQSLMDSVQADAWEQTGAVAWSLGGMDHHLWDRQRNLDRYESGDLTVWIDLSSRRGRATRGDRELTGAELDQALQTAWSTWANDSFWFNPVVKVFDEGTSRGLVTLEDGREALLVTYSSGGVTPGDSYLWIPGEDGRPEAWRMWVQILPVGGLQTSWDGWTQLPTGAWVSTAHTWPSVGLTIQVVDVRAAATLAELEPEDPFQDLMSGR